MRNAWIALGAILVASLLGAFLLGRALVKTTHTKPTLVPSGARIVSRATLLPAAGIPVQQVVVWSKPLADDPAVKRFGLDLWQGKSRIYEHRGPVNTESVAFETGDFSGDGHDDVLVFDNTDGSGGCGVYRALATASGGVQQAAVRLLCEDQGSIHLTRAGLVFRVGEEKDPKTAQQIHCCYRFLRTTVRRWNGDRLVVVRSSRTPLPGLFSWPPGNTPPGELRYCMRPGGPGNYLSASWDVSCRLAHRVQNAMRSPRCAPHGRCEAAGFTCVSLWNGRYGRPYNEVKSAVCKSGQRRVDMDEG